MTQLNDAILIDNHSLHFSIHFVLISQNITQYRKDHPFLLGRPQSEIILIFFRIRYVYLQISLSEISGEKGVEMKLRNT